MRVHLVRVLRMVHSFAVLHGHAHAVMYMHIMQLLLSRPRPLGNKYYSILLHIQYETSCSVVICVMRSLCV
jgi:hypothetical protein